VYALGFVSVFDQILDGFDSGAKDKIFSAYITALGEDPAKYRVRTGFFGGGGAGGRGRVVQAREKGINYLRQQRQGQDLQRIHHCTG
jgi:hypothetical protein